MLKQHTGDKVYREELDNWDTAYWPRYTTYQTHQSSVNRPLTINNDRYMQDVSYIRLKNITVDYTFPDRICKRLHIKGLKSMGVGREPMDLFAHVRTLRQLRSRSDQRR